MSILHVPMEEISCAGNRAYLEYALCDNGGRLVAASFFRREQDLVRALAAGISLNSAVQMYGDGMMKRNVYPVYGENAEYKAYFTTLGGSDSFTAGLAVLDTNKTGHLICKSGDEGECFYNYLMNNYDLPLLREWGKTLFNAVRISVYMSDTSATVYAPDRDILEKTIPLNGEDVKLKDVRIYTMQYVQNFGAFLETKVSELLKKGMLRIADKPQKHFEFAGLDDYMQEYGASIIENLEREIHPLTELSGEANNFTVLSRPLYPQQIAMVNGAVALLNGVGSNRKERKKTSSPFVIMNMSMGSGKTYQSLAMVEACECDRLIKKGRTLEQIYDVESTDVNYRAVVICPGHLVHKWAREVVNNIPYSKAEVVTDLSSLAALKGTKPKGREYYILSKDFAKLSYEERPAVTHMKQGFYHSRTCKSCGKENVTSVVCKCGSTKFNPVRTKTHIRGMVCPGCGEICIPYTRVTCDSMYGLEACQFETQKTTNERCMYCGESLWQPHVKNLTTLGGEQRHSPWFKQTYYANATHKGTKTIWVHEKYVPEGTALNEIRGTGKRKIAPADYIKRQLGPGFFDYLIADEVHNFKSPTSSQAIAFHALIKASKKQLVLTGTIAGGYADHLFYLLYRLCPERMKKAGYDWGSRMKFIEHYGSIESSYELKEGYNNKMSRGRQISQPKSRPGISPRIFTDFLLDRALFLDLSDLSKYMPKLSERVVTVNADPVVFAQYQTDLSRLKGLCTKGGLGMKLMSATLQYSLSYLDKPYGREPIKHPDSGDILLKPVSFDGYRSQMLPKEEKLVELLKAELSENRRAFVFAEFTGQSETCVTERLRDVIESEIPETKGKVFILDCDAVPASDREAWITKKACDGDMMVCITNPKAVETGLDLLGTDESGKTFNFPTLIFYQMGYSLFTIWQASHRHLRLNQPKDCRTYYMAYSDTPQQAVIALIARKMSATSAIQGTFSSEGLAAMAQGVDARVALAQSLSNMDYSTKNELQEMFDVVATRENPEDERYSGVTRMKLLTDIIKSVEITESSMVEVFTEKDGAVEIPTEDPDDIFDIFRFFEDVMANPAFDYTITDSLVTEYEPVVLRKRRPKQSSSQVSFF